MIKDTLFAITEAHPETLDVFISRGFPQMGDPVLRETFGKQITLETALMLKGINSGSFLALLEETISKTGEPEDITLTGSEKTADLTGETISVMGLLPCPVRIPLLEKFEQFSRDYTRRTGTGVNYKLQAASMGLGWIEEHILKNPDPDSMPDLFISAGFDLFFDEKKIGKHRKSGFFRDMASYREINETFKGCGLPDPEGNFSIIGAVPAVFLINRDELKGRIPPETWEDILKPEFANSVSLPMSDFDLFNAILLNLYKQYGREGIRKLGRSLLQSMHPAEMVKSSVKTGPKPAVTIMPSFFTQMAKGEGPLTAVWPGDGAIISPIFILTKKSKENLLKPVVDFFASEEVGKVLSGQGNFPVCNPDVDNRTEGKPFLWIGWDFINSHDVSGTITECMGLFHEGARSVKEAV